MRKRSGRILIATSRFRFVSRARYTSPMPPAPSAADFVRAETGAWREGQLGWILRASLSRFAVPSPFGLPIQEHRDRCSRWVLVLEIRKP